VSFTSVVTEGIWKDFSLLGTCRVLSYAGAWCLHV